MKKQSFKLIVTMVALFSAFGLIAAACSHNDDEGSSVTTQESAATTTTQAEETCSQVDDVDLQLQWVTQSQFAGYYAAVDQDFYSNLCLNVTILEGAVDIVPANVLESGGSDFAISWVPKVLKAIEDGTADIVNIAQVFERSGTLQVSFKNSGITSPSDLANKTVGNWGFGNEFELLAGLRQSGIDPDNQTTLVSQQFDMSALLNGEIDAAQAMIYNEYAQVLETVNEDTGELYTADDLNVIDWNDVGTAMLQDAIWADKTRLENDAGYRNIAERFVEASLEGWIWCRDNSAACVDVVLSNSTILGRSHQTWQLNEINGLIWPATNGVSVMVTDLATQTASVATSEDIVDVNPGTSWYRTDIAEAAVENLKARNLDTEGSSWQKSTVTLNEGGN